MSLEMVTSFGVAHFSLDIEHAISTRWLANLNEDRNIIPMIYGESTYKNIDLIDYQSEDFLSS